MRFTGFIGPSYVARSVNFDCQRCINLYPELNEIGTGKEREVACLVSTPGLSLFANLGAGPTRGSYVASNGRTFIVSGDKLYEIFADGTSVERLPLTTSLGQVSMADSGNYLAVVDGSLVGKFLKFSDNSVSDIPFPSEINFIPFKGCHQLLFQDDYFIFLHKDTNDFFRSDSSKSPVIGENETTINDLNFYESNGSPDKIIGFISDHRDLWVCNEKSIEIFFNSGDINNTFQRVEGAFVEVGLVAPFSLAKMNHSVFWLGRDEGGSGIVYRSQGYQPQRISTHAVEIAIQGYADISDAVAFTYQEDGHYFYVLNFPTANTTWCFDTSTNLWHERVYTNQGQFERHRANSHIFAFGKHLVGDYANGNVYVLSGDIYSDYGDAITRRRISPHITSELKRIFYHSFQLDMETGVGLDGIQLGTDPQVMLRFSNDGGHSWSNENWKSAGKIGQTKWRTKFNRLGSSRDRVFEITITDPVKVILLGAELQTEVGSN